MLKHRLIVGPILIALLLVLVWADDALDRVTLEGVWQTLFRGKEHPPRGLLLFTFGLAIMPLAARELAEVFRRNHIMTHVWLTTVAAMLGFTLSYSIPYELESPKSIAIVTTGMFGVFILSLLTFSRNKNVEGVVAAAGAVVFAMIYLGLMLGFLLALRRWHSAWWIVGIILTTKACDIGAYFTGRAIGRHKMIPWLSPGKTWEGMLGGIALATVVGVGMAALSQLLPREQDQLPLWIGGVCGIAFAIVGQLGDLTMSLLKRGAGMKDSSQLLPGMGGVMDVLDSPLMVAPVAYWLLMLLPMLAVDG